MDTDNILIQDLAALEVADEKRKKNIIGLCMDVWLEAVRDVTEDLEQIIDETKSVNAREKALCNLLSGIIVEATGGNMTVLEYVQKQMSKQSIHVFVGTHWVTIRTQVYYDFVKDACYKAGLSSSYAESPTFMNKVFEQVAFGLARDRQTYQPKDAVWINLQNGTLEIEHGEATLRAHNRDDFFTYVLPYAYDPMATCPRWEKFLCQVLPEEDSRLLLGEYIGYCLTTNLKLEKMAVFYGTGANGKSVCTDVIAELLGRGNVSHVDLEKLTTDDNHRIQIEGKLANISQENGPNVQYSILKNMVSGEPVMVKSLYKDVRLMTNYGKLIASYNTLPKTENTLGFFRRWLLFKFNVTIPEKERDVYLTQKLIRELPGILNWVLTCLKKLIEDNAFIESQACKEALNEYRVSSNSAMVYFDERLVIDDEGRLQKKELFADYLSFCREENYKNPYGKINFFKQLETIGVKTNTFQGTRYFNVKFKTNI